MPLPPTIELPALAALPRAPIDVARRWPAARGLLMLLSGRHHPRWARHSVLAVAPPAEGWLHIDAAHPDPLSVLRDAAGARDGDAGLWIGSFGYELGRAIEPAARAGAARRHAMGAWPIVSLARPEVALIHDGATGGWHGRGPHDALRRLVASIVDAPPERTPGAATGRVSIDDDLVAPAAWMEGVAKTVSLIRDGDLFQANLTRPLRVRLDGPCRATLLELLGRAEPWHGALIEMPDGHAIASLSPELFLEATLPRAGAGGHVVTRPMKGTRPASAAAEDLRDSAKDTAELVMIVDLMRNDLGRVCTIGSVRVSEARTIESHPTVHQGVATIEGALRPDVDLAALLGATFPPGSVTGAPKVRAMQVIESLEPFARGPYCGAIGLLDDDGTVRLNVAIRTLALAPPAPDRPEVREGVYGVGCGIVVDSDPLEEYRESVCKAEVIGAALEPAAPDPGAGRNPGAD